MKASKSITAGLLCLGLILTLLSVPAGPVVNAHSLAAASEMQVTGGDECAFLAGVASGLALSALTPCSIICAVGAWYVVGAIAVSCG